MFFSRVTLRHAPLSKEKTSRVNQLIRLCACNLLKEYWSIKKRISYQNRIYFRSLVITNARGAIRTRLSLD